MITRRTNGFTLIEMLAVLVIMGIVVAIAIPVVTNLMKSGGLNAASRQVSSTLSLARQYAITHRTNTRVVFSYRGTMFTPNTNSAPWYQSYAVVELGSTTNYLTKWEFLPLGTVFMDKNNSSLSLPSPPGLDDLGPPANLFFPSTNSTPSMASLAYIEFTPTGAARQPSTFTITEGLVNNGTIVTPTSKTSTNTLANEVRISVDSVVGRIQVTHP